MRTPGATWSPSQPLMAWSSVTSPRRARYLDVFATPKGGAARVRRAQRLLETTGLSVEEVATEVVFRSACVLRQHFGGIVGTNPLAYRRTFSAGPRVGP